jgi:hypothetical protein
MNPDSTSGGIPTTKAAALLYVSKGFPVLPCHAAINGFCTCGGRNANCKPGKHPLTPHGLKDATTDPATITGWWEQWTFANVALATGRHFFAVDIDPRHGGDKTLASMVAKHGPLPTTPQVATGGGGEQYYLRYPVGAKIRSRSGVAEGIDVRGDNGYVLAPPSIHASGIPYRWIVGLETPLADPPEWVLALVVETPFQQTTGNVVTLTMGSSDFHDLATHPGAGEGHRNSTLCRLLGVHLRRGDSPSTIEALALSWAARCEPPLPEAKVWQALRWVESKRGLGDDHQSTVTVGASKPSEIVISFGEGKRGDESPCQEPPTVPSTPEPGRWPELSPDALYGPAGEIVRAVAPETEADPAGVLLSLLTAFGNAVGKGAHFTVGPQSHYANLFIALIGDTASAKSQAQGIAMHMMRLMATGWEAECVSYGLSSGEGLIDRVRDPDPDEGENLVLVVPEVKRLLCIEEEFAKPITAMRREGNTLSAILRAAWDSKPLEVLTRGKSKLLASNAHVSIAAHITPEELDKLLGKSVEVANGFANRFLWICVKRSRLLPHGGNVRVLDGFVDPLRKALAHAQRVGQVRRSPEADALWEDAYPGLADARPGAFGRVTERARPQVMRLALLYALLDCSDVIQVEHLRAALALWRCCEESAKRIFGGGGEQGQGVWGQSHATVPMPLHLRLLDIIVKTPGVTRRGLHEKTGNRVKAEDMETALSLLETQRLAHRSLCQSEGGGRPAECWWPGPSDDPGDDNPSDGDSDDSQGVTFTMGGGDPVATDSTSASAQARSEVAGVGRPASASLLEETEGVGTGLRTKEQTPAPPPVPEIISSQTSFAGGFATGGGNPPPPSTESVRSLAGGGADVTDRSKAPSHHPSTPTPDPQRLSSRGREDQTAGVDAMPLSAIIKARIVEANATLAAMCRLRDQYEFGELPMSNDHLEAVKQWEDVIRKGVDAWAVELVKIKDIKQRARKLESLRRFRQPDWAPWIARRSYLSEWRDDPHYGCDADEPRPMPVPSWVRDSDPDWLDEVTRLEIEREARERERRAHVMSDEESDAWLAELEAMCAD